MGKLLGDEDFLALTQKLRRFSNRRNKGASANTSFKFPEDVEPALDINHIAFKIEQIQGLLNIIGFNNSLKLTCKFNLGSTPLINTTIAAFICTHDNISDVIVAYELTPQHFADFNKHLPNITLSSVLNLDQVIELPMNDMLLRINSSIPAGPKTEIEKLFSPRLVKKQDKLTVLTAACNSIKKLEIKNTEWANELRAELNKYKKDGININKKLLKKMDDSITKTFDKLKMSFETRYADFVDLNKAYDEAISLLDLFMDGFVGDARKYSEWAEKFNQFKNQCQVIEDKSYEEQVNFELELDVLIMLFADYYSLANAISPYQKTTQIGHELKAREVVRNLLFTIISPAYSLASAIICGSGVNVSNNSTEKFVIIAKGDLHTLIDLIGISILLTIGDGLTNADFKTQADHAFANFINILITQSLIKDQLTDKSYQALNARYNQTYTNALIYVNSISRMIQHHKNVASVDVELTQLFATSSCDEKLVFLRQIVQSRLTEIALIPGQLTVIELMQNFVKNKGITYADDSSINLTEWIQNHLLDDLKKKPDSTEQMDTPEPNEISSTFAVDHGVYRPSFFSDNKKQTPEHQQLDIITGMSCLNNG